MKPLFEPQLVNPPLGDPALYLDGRFERRALLFDLGDIAALPERKLLRVSDVFVSHTHMDHFVGLDRLVRIALGRDKRVRLYGPTGFIDRVEHKLAGYTWNLVQGYDTDFTLCVTEALDLERGRYAEFHCRRAFAREAERAVAFTSGLLLEEPLFAVRFTLLDHRIPSLAFCLEERRHISIWPNRLAALGLATGPWLYQLKRLIAQEAGDNTPVTAPTGDGGSRNFTLGELKAAVLSLTPGQRIAYVTDAAGHETNGRRIVALARDADLLFIEAGFLQRDAVVAAAKYHLTAYQAGQLARTAGARRVIPFHYSARHSHEQTQLELELRAGFEGKPL